MGTAETALGIISVFVVLSGLMVMLTMLLSSLNERRREMAILRSVGARPAHIFTMFITEAGILTLAGAFIGVALLYLGLFIAQPIINDQFGLLLSIGLPSNQDFLILSFVILAGLIAGIVPAYHAYRHSLADGMIVRI